MVWSLLFSGLRRKRKQTACKCRAKFHKKTAKKKKKPGSVTHFLMSASSLMRSSVEILPLSCRYSGENLPSMSKLPWASLNTCLEKGHSRKVSSDRFSCYFGILGNGARCLTWPPRRRASCTDPGADTPVWRFSAPSGLSATRKKTATFGILDNLAADLNVK